jgi:hypothetical protein
MHGTAAPRQAVAADGKLDELDMAATKVLVSCLA